MEHLVGQALKLISSTKDPPPKKVIHISNFFFFFWGGGRGASPINYSDKVDGPDNGWLGWNSLSKQATIAMLNHHVFPQGIQIDSFEEFIEQNKPVTFTDPKVQELILST